MAKTALIIVDMVRDFTSPDGKVFYPQNQAILPNIQKVLAKCREYGALIIFIRNSYRKDKYDMNLQTMRV
ncbi:MAG: isochorismatase family protein, partial [[Clostridium] cellulosi]